MASSALRLELLQRLAPPQRRPRRPRIAWISSSSACARSARWLAPARRRRRTSRSSPVASAQRSEDLLDEVLVLVEVGLGASTSAHFSAAGCRRPVRLDRLVVAPPTAPRGGPAPPPSAHAWAPGERPGCLPDPSDGVCISATASRPTMLLSCICRVRIGGGVQGRTAPSHRRPARRRRSPPPRPMSLCARRGRPTRRASAPGTPPRCRPGTASTRDVDLLEQATRASVERFRRHLVAGLMIIGNQVATTSSVAERVEPLRSAVRRIFRRGAHFHEIPEAAFRRH